MTEPFVSGRLTRVDEAAAVASTGGWVRASEPGIDPFELPRPPIFGDAAAWDALVQRLPEALPATRVLGLPGARVVGLHGWVVTPDDGVVTSLSWYETFGTPSISKIGWSSERHLTGTVLNLGTMNARINYGHFLCDGVGRLGVAERAGIDLADVDHVVVPDFPSAGARAVLDHVGIDPARRVVLEAGESITGDLVLAPSMPGTTRIYRSVVPDVLRRSRGFTGRADGGPRYLLGRGGDRRMVRNAAAVEEVAQDHGFMLVRPEKVDLPALLSEAGAVLGEHGAAMADLAYCRPGTAAIEIMPSDHMFPYWYTLAAAADLDYSVVIGDSDDVRDPGEWGSSEHGLTVDTEQLDAALRTIGAS